MAATMVIVVATDLANAVQPGAKLFAYAAGTTTPQAMYTDSGLGTATANPLVCDASGRGVAWLDSNLGDYKLVLKDSAEATTFFSQDNITVGSNPQIIVYPAAFGDISAAELAQLQNIDTTTISAAQWGYLGAALAYGGSLLATSDAASARALLELVDQSITFASQAEAEAVTIDTKSMNPLRTGQAIDANIGTSTQAALDAKVATADLASQVEAQAGTNNTKWMSPLRTKEAIEQLAPTSGLKSIVNHYNAVGDGVRVDDAAISASGTTLTSASNPWASGDVGKLVKVKGAGTAGADLATTIATFNSAGSVEVTAAASTTVSNAKCVFGTDDQTAIQAAIDSNELVFAPAGVYCHSGELTVTDGGKIVGAGSFFSPRENYSYKDYNPTVFAYLGSNATDATAWRFSETAVGVVGTDFTDDGTDTHDLLDFSFRDSHIDAFGQYYGAYFYRCGANSSVSNVTAEDATQACMWGNGLFSTRWGMLGCHRGRNQGARFGIDDYTFGSESSLFAFHADFYCNWNGRAGTFVKGSGTEEDGCGASFRGGKGSRIGIQAEVNDGHAFIVRGFGDSYPCEYRATYMEANGEGPLIHYDNNTNGVHITDAFVHAGNGGSINPETIEIRADAADNGPSNPSSWLVLRNLHAIGASANIEIDSNTYKYRVEDCQDDINYLDKKPAALDSQRIPHDAGRNGQFAVWQRGTSFTSDGYGPDGWLLALSGATGTLTQETPTPGTILGLDSPEPQYYAKLVISAANADAGLKWRIPGVRSYAGQVINFSVYAFITGSTDDEINVDAIQHFGTGGSPSTDVTTTIGVMTLSANWRRYSVSALIPATTGKVYGTNDDDYLDIHLYNPDSETFTLFLTCAQIDIGWNAPATFRLRSYDEELRRCLPYFQRLTSGVSGSRPGPISGVAVSGTIATLSYNFLAPMRATPTLTLSATGDFNALNNTGGNSTLSQLIFDAETNHLSGKGRCTISSGAFNVAQATTILTANTSATMDLDADL